jgi:peptidoglycan/xylan/chitin deacetylase (PgdA/CDA1 family)
MDSRAICRRLVGDLLMRRSLRGSMRSASGWIAGRRGIVDGDPHNTFDQIMDMSEARNLTSAFFFITDHTAGLIDGRYQIGHRLIRKLLWSIHSRGHEIGLHPSHNSFLDPDQTGREFSRLRAVCESEGIKQERWGGRQHNLRWNMAVTPRNWEAAGLDYDSTLGFAERVGFRCGVCYEYPLYDLRERRRLRLRERPLVVMDCTVTDDRYMGLGKGSDAADAVRGVKQACRAYGGEFTLLWHNSRLMGSDDLVLYSRILDA